MSAPRSTKGYLQPKYPIVKFRINYTEAELDEDGDPRLMTSAYTTIFQVLPDKEYDEIVKDSINFRSSFAKKGICGIHKIIKQSCYEKILKDEIITTYEASQTFTSIERLA